MRKNVSWKYTKRIVSLEHPLMGVGWGLGRERGWFVEAFFY